MDNFLVAVLAMTLQRFTDPELCALNLAIESTSRLPRENIAFRPALDTGLIKPDGTYIDKQELERALTYAVNNRITL